MELTPGTTIHGFAIKACEDLPEIEGVAYIGRHERSGARLLCLANDDDNKSFAIGFRTPPKDDTGVFHILEHSVLCGSRKFPVKEPFVDLLKGSMQTFLNAMTFADKTLYPVASTNEQDLFNLMDVYLDAVFHPRIYEKKAIFEQEGWHYELLSNNGLGDPAEMDAEQTTLVHNGVVFNEMKGALSDAGSVLYDEIQKSLFPDTCYAFESGGTPQAIPTLTYEEYLDEHRRHYRTDNSYITLYGNLDMAKTLAFLDEQYLSPIAIEQEEADRQRESIGLDLLRPRTIEPQSPLRAPFYRQNMNTAPENACAACGYVVGDSSDRMRAAATEILLDALFGSNEAPLKRALLDEGVAHDVSAFLSDGLLQPFAVIQAQMPSEGAGEKLQSLIASKAESLLASGLDKELVEASLSNAEFQMREHDMGTADGVIYAMTSHSSWLYDDDAPIDYLRYESMFASLRERLEGDYFDCLCRELLCENEHTAAVEIVPVSQQLENDSADALAALNKSLSPSERKAIVNEVVVLRELQEAPDSPEAMATLPRLAVSDIAAMPEAPSFEVVADSPVACVRHSMPTHGISYASRFFDAGHIAFDDFPYIAILALVLGKLDTAQHSAPELDTLIQGKLGNLSFFVNIYEDRDDPSIIMPKFVVGASALSENRGWLATLPREIMLETDFSDTERILDILKQRKISLEQGFANAGHSCATARVKSYFTHAGMIQEQIGNVDFYRFLCNLIDCYEERADHLVTKLDELACQLLCDDNCTISFAGAQDDYEAFWEADPKCGRSTTQRASLVVPTPEIKNEAFVVPTDVCFAGMGWDHRLLDQEYDGSWLVAARALSLDFLWNEVRVKGGAYGVGFQAQSSGALRFYTYRDPRLDESLERIASASKWIASYDPSPEEMDGFVVATVAALDAPVKPRQLIKRQMSQHFRNQSPETRRILREQALATSLDEIRGFAKIAEETVDARAICAFGNRSILESSNAGLKVITLVG